MGQQLENVSKALQTAIAFLKGSAFVGLFGNHVMATYMEQVQKEIANFSKRCLDMSGDLLQSAEAYERGDAAGATRFH